jgi:tetratricopeptide (TPR) repeat protein
MTAPSTDLFVNYYEILGLQTNAAPDAIEQKIKEEIRNWRRRTGSADLGKRQEAELRMKHLAAARENLLDPDRRAAYDKRLAGQQSRASRPVTTGGTRDWVGLAEQYLAQNDYDSAAYAAREATQTEGNSAVAWSLRARANAGLGNLNDAMYEAREATELDAGNAQYHFDLGSVFEQLQRWPDALTTYTTAAELEPANYVYRLAVAGVYVQQDLPDRALPIVEEIYHAHPDKEYVNCALAEVLLAAAESVPAFHHDDTYLITSPEEIAKMESMISRARGLRGLDPDLVVEIDKTLAYLAECRSTKFNLPPFLARRSLLLKGIVFVAPVFLFLSALGNFSGNPGAGFLLLLIAGLLGFVLVRSCWIPMWKRNRRAMATGSTRFEIR